MNYHGKRDSGSTTQLVDGVHHVTFLTENMDRLLAFYVRVFDAEVTLDMIEEGLRHAFFEGGTQDSSAPLSDAGWTGPSAPLADVQPRGQHVGERIVEREGSCVSGSRRRAPPTATSGT